MANSEYLDLLNQGVEVWNTWRQDNPGLHVNLNEASLAGAQLPGADLRKVFMISTDLQGSNLSDANLSDAVVREADLRGCTSCWCRSPKG